MTEAYLKGKLKKAILKRMPKARVYRHEDHFTGGIPDLSVTLPPLTCWVEVKYARPGRHAEPTKLQRQELEKLRGLLVTYVEVKADPRTIVKRTTVIVYDGPHDIHIFDGFAHDEVAEIIATRCKI